MASTDARPVPIKNTAFRVYFGMFKPDGTMQSAAASVSAQISKDGGNFAAAGGTVTEIQSTAVYYLDLTNTEMNADSVVLKVTATGIVPVVVAFYPEETGDINVDVTAFNGTAATAASGRPEVNATHIDGVTAENLRRAFANMTLITANGTPSSTTLTNATLTSATNDKYKGRPLYYLTGNLAGEIVEVTAYNGTSKTLTHTASPSGLAATAGDLALLA